MSRFEVWLDWATWQASVIMAALAAGCLLGWWQGGRGMRVRAAAAQRLGLAVGMGLLSLLPGWWWLRWGLG